MRLANERYRRGRSDGRVILKLIHSKDWWDVENGLTIFESASLTYGEMNPEGLMEIVVGSVE